MTVAHKFPMPTVSFDLTTSERRARSEEKSGHERETGARAESCGQSLQYETDRSYPINSWA